MDDDAGNEVEVYKSAENVGREMMKKDEATIGARVKLTCDFPGLSVGTEGIIDSDYNTGVMVAWDLPDRPLPPGYRYWDSSLAWNKNILRDGFNKERELQYLELVQP